MALVKYAFLMVLIGNAVGNSQPAVRLKITQKGLNYAMANAVKQTKHKLKTLPIQDMKGHSELLNCNYAVTNISVTKVYIPTTSLRPVPNNGLFSVVRNVDLDLKGNWKYKMTWFSYNGGFKIKIKGMSVGILVEMVANNSHLVVSNVTCASRLNNVNIYVTGPNSWIFQAFKGYVNGLLKTKIPQIVCEQAKKRIKQDLNKHFSDFPVKRHLKSLVTLDYSVIQNPVSHYNSVDMFFKGEFQPSDGSKIWMHEPRRLPYEMRRNRMMYVTITDHMANSAGQAFYNRGLMKVNISAKQAHVRNQIYFNTSAFRNLPTIYGLYLIHVACPNCDLHIKMEATSPPRFNTNNSGIHIGIQGIANVNAVYPNNSSRTVLVVAMNVTATATPKLNGTTLIPVVHHVRVRTRILKPKVVTVTPGRIMFLEGFVKREVENLMEKHFSAFRIPLPVSSKIKLVKPKVSYGQRYATLESDIQLI